MELAQSSFKVCLHVTSADAIDAILVEGLVPRIGPLSAQLESHPGIFMFPSWDDMMDANWLFDEAWPYDSEPALLCVNTEGLELDSEVGYEVVFREKIDPSRITVIAPGELDWDNAKRMFEASGGRVHSNSRGVIAIEPERVKSAPIQKRMRP